MRLRHVGAAVGLGVLLVLVAASPAAAHATLVQSDPVPGGVLLRSPRVVTLRFDSPVSAALGAVRVYDRSGGRVDNGGVDVSGSTVRLAMPHIGNGAYVVTWRVTSADTHPVDGAFTFQVGNAGNANSPAVTGLAQRLLGAQGGDAVVGAVYGATRGLVFAGLALLLGAAAFGVIVWPGARGSRRATQLVWSGWVALLVGTVVGLLVYGPYAAGLGLGDATKFSLLSTTLGTRFGELASVRLLLLVLAVPVLRALLARGGPSSPIPARWLAFGGGTLAVLLAATPGLAGHAVTGRWVTAAVMADTLHVLAMAVWLGGLVMLVSVLLPKRSVAELRDALPRWSRVAAGCVIVIVGTGAFQAWRQVDGLAELRATDYGRILVVKVVLFAVILTLASFAREIVFHLFPRSAAELGVRMPVVAGGSDDDPRHREAHDPDAGDGVDEAKALRNLRRSVWAELGVGVAVLIVTALLVNAAPARTAAAGSGNATSVGLTLKSATVRVDVLLTPGQPGPNDVHVSTLRNNGATQDVQDLRLTLDLPSRKIAPITVPVTRLSAGHYLASSVALPIAGTWRVTAYPRLSQFDEVTLTGTFDLGS